MKQQLWVRGCLVALCLAAAAARADEIDCGSLQNAYGPYDYTNAEHRRDRIPIVEQGHFNTDVETLRKGISDIHIIGDLDYTLRAVPNHHRALATVSRFYLNGGHQGVYRSAECYFDRAMRFAPNDGDVYLLFGVYLHQRKKYDDAEKQYQRALELLENSADAHYDIALLYADMGRWDEAKREAIRAYQLGYPLEGLKNRLRRHGSWSKTDDLSLAVADSPQEAPPQ